MIIFLLISSDLNNLYIGKILRQTNNKMKNNCILCGNKEKVNFLKARDRHNPTKEYQYKRCTSCNLVMLENRIDNKEFYTYNLKPKISAPQKFVLWMFFQRLRKLKRKGKVLDFGCGVGNLAKYLSKKSYNVDCFEVDKQSIDWIKNVQKLPLVKNLGNKKYDIIVSEQVMEHLPDPLSTFKKLATSLKDDGIMLISIPNINSLQAKFFKERWFHLDVPRHLNHFYKNSFEILSKKAGLKIIKKHYFNIHIDPTGWYWSLKGIKNKDYDLTKISNLVALGMFVPLTFLTSIFGLTSYVLHVLKKNMA